MTPDDAAAGKDRPSFEEVYEQVDNAIRVQGSGRNIPPNVDQFAALAIGLISDPEFCAEVDKAVRFGKSSGDYVPLLTAFQGRGINPSAQAVAYFVTTEYAWYDIRELGKLFGHTNIGTFN